MLTVRILVAITGIAIGHMGCCKARSHDSHRADKDTPGAAASTRELNRPDGTGKLASLTSEVIVKLAAKDGYSLSNKSTDRSEIPGVVMTRVSLEHEKRGGADVELHDFSGAASSEAEMAVRLGTDRVLCVQFEPASLQSASALRDTLLARNPLGELTRSSLHAWLESEGWTSIESSSTKDDEVIQTSAWGSKGDSRATLMLLDYGQPMAGANRCAGAIDGERVLVVCEFTHAWAKSLLKTLLRE